ncbi:MAG: hypothetical protein H6643_08435 [Caldilineaceae bacterium]|nr:hypothetical protein [Caldilineaceae bacterium]
MKPYDYAHREGRRGDRRGSPAGAWLAPEGVGRGKRQDDRRRARAGRCHGATSPCALRSISASASRRINDVVVREVTPAMMGF